MAFAQEIRLNAYGHYVFDDRVESYYSNNNYFNGTIRGGLLWGIGAEFRTLDYYGVEALYMKQSTTVPVHYYDNSSFAEKDADINLKINWVLLGGMRVQKINKQVEGYAGFLLGLAILNADNPDNQHSASATKFAWGLKAGSNVFLTDKLGIKVQMQLLSATQAAGGSLYFSTAGSGAAVTTYSSMLQFSIGGGLTYKLR
jgi:hypothetical protein